MVLATACENEPEPVPERDGVIMSNMVDCVTEPLQWKRMIAI